MLSLLTAAVLLPALALAAPAPGAAATTTTTISAAASSSSASATATATYQPPACQQPFSTPLFTLTDLYFHSSRIFTTPAHQNDAGEVSFELANSAVPYLTSCHAYSSQLSDFFYGNQWYACDDVPGIAASTAWARFRYDRPTGRVDLEVGWQCWQADPEWVNGGYPIIFTAEANGTKTLDCTYSDWKNPNWTTPGDIYEIFSTECEKTSLTMSPWQISAVA